MGLPGIFVTLLILHQSFAPPVTQNKGKEDASNHLDPQTRDDPVGGLEDYMEYHRYLKEVVNALESDPDFRQKLEKAEEHDIRSGKIAEELEFVSHHVRTRLDEIKRVELNRLKDLTEQKRRLLEDSTPDDPTHHGHVDHANPHTFEIDDLKKLIAKTTEDLAEADRKRRDEFKQYELQKEFDKHVKLNLTDGEEERRRIEEEFKRAEEKHKKHEKLHEPGHKAQLEEVWQEQDQMQQDFDPKTFFMLHDIDSNGLWDQDEVKALFVKELQKMYAAGEPEDDMRERAEEMERMRESVFREVDLNRDGFIDFEEFLAQTKRNDFQQDNGWQGIDEKKPYTDEELEAFIKQHEMYPPQYQGHPPQFHPGNIPQHPGNIPQHPGNIPQHPGNIPQHPGNMPQHPGNIPQQHLPPLNTNEVYPQGGYQQQQQYQHQQVPQQYYNQPPPPPNNYNHPPPPPSYNQQQHNPAPPPPPNNNQQAQQQQQHNQPPPPVQQQLNHPPPPPSYNQQQPQQQNQPPQPPQQQVNQNTPPQVNQI